MSKVWVIARHEYSINVRRVGFIIMTALVPILGIVGLLASTFLGGQVPAFLESQFSAIPSKIGVVDELGSFTPILPAFHERYALYNDEEVGRSAVKQGDIAALIVIPKDYIASGDVVIISKDSGMTAAKIEDSTSSRQFFVEHLVRDKLDADLRERLSNPVNPVLVSLADESGTGGTGANAIANIMTPYFLAIMLIITIFVTSGYLLRGVADEKVNRVIEVLLSSVSAWDLLAGKVLGLGALGLTQVGVWVGSVIVIGRLGAMLHGFSIPLLARPEVFVLCLIYYLTGFLMYAVLMGSAGALGTTMQESQQMAGIFSFLAAIPMFFAGFVIANPNMILVRILSWFPLTAPTAMMLRIPIAEIPPIDIVVSLVMILLAIPVILWAGSKVFRMGLLMYGKRPTMRQVWRTIREA